MGQLISYLSSEVSMRPFYSSLFTLLCSAALVAQGAGKSVLFDRTHYEEGGSGAEWVICSGHEPDPYPASPTKEKDWNGGMSALAFDLHNQGYIVQTLPASTGRITYGDSANPQDLSRYNVFFIPECYTYFSVSEKAAIMAFVQHGGGLFLLGNHKGAARVSSWVPGSTDAFTVFNDLANNNGVANKAFGFTWVTGHGTGDSKANTTSTAYNTAINPITSAIIRGPNGTLAMQDFHSYAYLMVNTADNPSAQGILYTQVSGDSPTKCFITACTLGSGRVVATGDSSPVDDGTTTTPGKTLHNSYTLYSNRAFFLNAIAWLASSTTPNVETYTIQASAGSGGSISPAGSASVHSGASPSFTITPQAGYTISSVVVDGSNKGAVSSYTFSNVTANHTIAASFTATAGSNLSEGFEQGSKGSYATGNVTFASGMWALNDALLGTSSSDPKVGNKSVRIRNSGKLTMLFNGSAGAKTVSVKHASYGTDAATTWSLWYSVNGGSTWTQAGSTMTTSSIQLQTATFTVNLQQPIRFEIRKSDGSTRRLNIDDFQVSGF